jgi:hypothetical protein
LQRQVLELVAIIAITFGGPRKMRFHASDGKSKESSVSFDAVRVVGMQRLYLRQFCTEAHMLFLDPPHELTPDQRLKIIAAIFARGILRLADLDLISPEESGHPAP